MNLAGRAEWTDGAGVVHIHCARHDWSGPATSPGNEKPIDCPGCEAGDAVMDAAKKGGENVKESTVITEDSERITRTKPEQTTMDGFEQERIEEVEKWGSKYDGVREKIRKAKEQLENVGMKLAEAMHHSETKLQVSVAADGDRILIYKVPGFNIKVKRGKEKLNVKVGDDDKEGSDEDDQKEAF